MNEQWIEKYLSEHPQESFWNYLQNNPEESETLLEIDYADLNFCIEEAKRLHEVKEDSQKKSQLSLEEEILLAFIMSTQDLKEGKFLCLLFKVSRYTVEKIYSYWVSNSRRTYSLFHRVRLAAVVRHSRNRRMEPTEESSSCSNYYVKNGGIYGLENATFFGTMVAGVQCQSIAKANYPSNNLHSTSLSLNQRTEPLPHNGLFVRRNNQFGTRMSIGMKDLIDQGVMVDHTNIRFDDFVALNSERVPSPQADNSLAISYGIAPISLSQNHNDRGTHYLEIALKTAANAPESHPQNQAPPLNYIFVVDTSGSMNGEKLDAVKISIQELFKNLKEDDVIGIIEFDNRPKTLLPATPRKKIEIDRLSQLLSNMRADGGTDLNVALSFGIDEIGRHGRNHSLNQVYLFTDGNPTSGETDWIKIRQNIDAKTRGNIRLSTFAFGSDANLRELDALAGLTGGKSTFVTSPEDIRLSLQDELSRREHLAAINVQIKVDIDPEIEILCLYGHDLITDPATRAAVLQEVEITKKKSEHEFGVKPEADLVTKEEGIRIFVPNLAVGETYWIVFKLVIPENKQQTAIGKATVQYLDTFTRQNQKPEWELSFPGNLPADLVVEHGLALWTSEVAFFAIDDLYEQDMNTAKKRIENHVALLCFANGGLDSSYISDDIITLQKFLSLSENLGKSRGSSDFPPQGVQAYYVHSLSDFGRVRNGFNCVNYSC